MCFVHVCVQGVRMWVLERQGAMYQSSTGYFCNPNITCLERKAVTNHFPRSAYIKMLKVLCRIIKNGKKKEQSHKCQKFHITLHNSEKIIKICKKMQVASRICCLPFNSHDRICHSLTYKTTSKSHGSIQYTLEPK